MSKKNWSNIDVATLDFDDKKTWEMLQRGETAGVFQLESSGMTEACIRIQPDCMEHLIALLALFRPDTMGELEHYIKRKNGEEEVTYIHPDMEQITGESYGCLIYQEQIMKITQVFAGFSDAEADQFRKGIGKKKPELVMEQADKFLVRCLAKGYDEDIANTIASDLKRMGGYSFNKGHATGYGITSYKTAWLKANHAIQFMCATLSNQKKANGATDYEGVGFYLMKCKEMGIKVEYPDINESDGIFSFTLKETFAGVGVDLKMPSIRYGLNLIKGIGENAVKCIVELRPFTSFDDFITSIRTQCSEELKGSITKTTILSLIKAGCFDFTGKERSLLLKEYGEYRFENGLDDIKPIQNLNKKHIEQMLQARVIKDYEVENFDKNKLVQRWNHWKQLQHANEWLTEEMAGDEFNWEYDSLSYHLRGNPFEGVKMKAWEDYDDGDNNTKVGGTVISVKKNKIKKGKQIGKTMAFINLDTVLGVREVTVFADKWEQFQDVLSKGNMVVVKGLKQGEKMVLGGVKTLQDYRETEI